MPSPSPQLGQRLRSALIALPIMVGALYWSMWSYFICFFCIALLSLCEFYRLVALGGVQPQKYWGTFSGLLLYVLAFLHASGYLAGSLLYWLGPMIGLTCLFELYRHHDTPFTNIAYTLLGMLYVGMPFALLHCLAFVQGKYSYVPVLGVFVLIWANDTGAYLIGTSLGRRPLFQRISPGKSWEGSIGGAMLALITSGVAAHCDGSMDWSRWLGMASIVVVAGTYGDLVESMLKRSLQIKDSGQLIPGHGGLLDRFDSFLLAVPFLVAWMQLGG